MRFKHRRFVLGERILHLTFFGLAQLGTLRPQGIGIGNFQMLSHRRVGRSQFEYTMRATATNGTARPLSVRAQLEIAPGTGATVVDGDVSFAGIRPGESSLSDDTFAVRVDRSQSFGLDSFAWVVSSNPPPPFVVSNFRTWSQTRSGRTQFEYVVGADLLNFSGTNANVEATASLRSGSPLVLLDGRLSFPTSFAGDRRGSSDGIPLRLDRSIPLNLSDLQWSFSAGPMLADLSPMFDLPRNPEAGMPVTYRVGVTNHGPSAAGLTSWTASLPPNTTISSHSLPGGSCIVEGTNLVCTISSIPANTAVMAEVHVTFSSPGQRRISAQVDLEPTDTLAGNNSGEGWMSVADIDLAEFRIAGLGQDSVEESGFIEAFKPRGDFGVTDQKLVVGGTRMVSAIPISSIGSPNQNYSQWGNDTTDNSSFSTEGLLATDLRTRTSYVLQGPRGMGFQSGPYSLMTPVHSETGVPGGPVIGEFTGGIAVFPPVGINRNTHIVKETFGIQSYVRGENVVEYVNLIAPSTGRYRFVVEAPNAASLRWSSTLRTNDFQVLASKGGTYWGDRFVSGEIDLLIGQEILLGLAASHVDSLLTAGVFWQPPGTSKAVPIPTTVLHRPRFETVHADGAIQLSREIPVFGNFIAFSGWGKIGICPLETGEAYIIDTISGMVTTLTNLPMLSVHSDIKPVSGILEHSTEGCSFVFPMDGHTVMRRSPPLYQNETVAVFPNKRGSPHFAVAPWLDRWFFAGNDFGQYATDPPKLVAASAGFSMLPAASAGDVAIQGTMTPGPVLAGTRMTGNLTVTNRGAAIVKDLMVTNTVFGNVHGLTPSVAGGTCDVTGNEVVCILGDLPPFSSKAISIEFTPANIQTVKLYSTVSFNGTDSFPGNNSLTLFGICGTPVLSVLDCAVIEADDGGFSELIFPVLLSGPVTATVTIDYYLFGYLQSIGWLSVNRRIILPSGATRAEIRYAVPGNSLFGTYPDRINLSYSHSSPVEIVASSLGATGVILENDPRATFRVVGRFASEGDLAGTNTFVEVQLDRPSQYGLGLDITTEDLTAAAGIDYALPISSQHVYVPPLETNASIPLFIIGDREPESMESFRIVATPTSREGDWTDSEPQSAEMEIIDDDGPGMVDHFEFSVSTTNVPAGGYATATVTAKDVFGNVVTDFDGAVQLGLMPTSLLPDGLSSGTFRSDGYLFELPIIPDRNIEIVEFQVRGGRRTYLLGPYRELLFERYHADITNVWVHLPASSPVRLLAGKTYWLGSDQASGRVPVVAMLPETFSDGTLGQPVHYPTWVNWPFPTADRVFPWVNFRYLRTIEMHSVPNQSLTDWSGGSASAQIRPSEPIQSFRLAATDFLGHLGSSSFMRVGGSNDLSVSLSSSPQQNTAGEGVMVTSSIRHDGPEPASNVEVTCSLPTGACVSSVESTQGSCSITANQVICALGTMADGTMVNISVWFTLNGTESAPLISASLVSTPADDYLPNNSASLRIGVLADDIFKIVSFGPPTSRSLALPENSRLRVGGFATSSDDGLMNLDSGLFRLDPTLSSQPVQILQTNRMLVTDLRNGQIYALKTRFGLAGNLNSTITGFVPLNPATGEADSRLPAITLPSAVELGAGCLLLDGYGKVGVWAATEQYYASLYVVSTTGRSVNMSRFNVALRFPQAPLLGSDWIGRGIIEHDGSWHHLIYANTQGSLIRQLIGSEPSYTVLTPPVASGTESGISLNLGSSELLYAERTGNQTILRSRSIAFLPPTPGRPRFDVSASLAIPNQPSAVQGVQTYGFFAINNGTQTASNVVLAAQVPPTFQIRQITSSVGTITQDDHQLFLRIPTLDPGTSAALEVSASPTEAMASGIVAQVTMVQCDSRPDNDRIVVPVVSQRPTFIVDDLAVQEGDVGLVFSGFTVGLPEPLLVDVSFHVEIVSFDPAVISGQDYNPPTTLPFSIPAGSLEVFVPISVLSDRIWEGDEIAYLNIHSEVNAQRHWLRPALKIIDDDPNPRISLLNVRSEDGLGRILASRAVASGTHTKSGTATQSQVISKTYIGTNVQIRVHKSTSPRGRVDSGATQLELRWNSDSNSRRWRVETSSNLVDWVVDPVEPQGLDGGEYRWPLGLSGPARFFRVLEGQD